MIGTIINCTAIALCAMLGIMLRKGLPEKVSQTMMDGFGLLLIILGVQSGLAADNMVIVVISLILGALVGELIDIHEALERFGARIEKRVSGSGGQFGKAFVFTSLLYCTGAMAIMGPLEDGLRGDYKILLVKSLLDGISSLIFSASMGIGVLFSAIPVLVYQGSISLMAGAIKPFLTPAIMNNLTSLGGVLILGIGTNILKLTNVKIANLLPGIFLVPLVMYIAGLLF